MRLSVHTGLLCGPLGNARFRIWTCGENASGLRAEAPRSSSGLQAFSPPFSTSHVWLSFHINGPGSQEHRTGRLLSNLVGRLLHHELHAQRSQSGETSPPSRENSNSNRASATSGGNSNRASATSGGNSNKLLRCPFHFLGFASCPLLTASEHMVVTLSP